MPSHELSESQAEEIARAAETEGWQVAAHDRLRAFGEQAYREAVDESRGQIGLLLPICPPARVLHLRCGWGPVAMALAQSGTRVVALDDRVSRVRFVAARSRQSGAHGLDPVVAGRTGVALPFQDATFDGALVVDPSWDDVDAALVELRRVVRPGGWVLLAAANRFGLAATGSRRAARSSWGYRRALARAGFRVEASHAPLPSHREPFFILPLDRRDLLSYFVDHMLEAQDYRAKLDARGLGMLFVVARLGWKAARRLRMDWLARMVVPSYAVVAEA